MESTPTEPIFPRLSSGPRKMEAEAVARHQRGRLEGAMVELVARNGFEATTLRELVSLAGVSKSTFYEHFESKQECFLCTFDDIVLEVARRIDEQFARPGDLREKLRAALTVFADLAAGQQAAASLVTVESLTLGAAAVGHRERASVHFEELLKRGFAGSPSPHELSELTARGIIAGIRNCAYQRLRNGEAGGLPDVVEPMVEWILSYARAPSEPARRAAAAVARETAAAAAAAAAPDGPPPDPGGGSEPGTAERIAMAAAELAYENGYEGLSIPAISSAAGVSNKTFYDNYPGKREAFTAGFDAVAQTVMISVAAAFAAEDEHPEAIGAGLRVLLEHAGGDGLFSRLAFFELPMAGPAALDQADRTLGGFAAFLGPPEAEGGPPDVVKESVVGGSWAVIQHEIAAGRRAGLPGLGPEIAEFVMAPLGPRDQAD